MKHYANITAGILTRKDLVSTDAMLSFLELLEVHTIFCPTHIGNSEPISSSYGGPAATASLWQDPFLWKNRKSGVSGSIWFGNNFTPTWIYSHLSPHRPSESLNTQLVSYFLDTCQLMDADFGYTHLVTDSEFENKNVPHEWTYAVDVGLTEQNLIADLAKLCWGLYLGGRLASMVELKERIKSAHVVRLFPDGSMYIQLTNSIFDIWKNYEGFNVQRTKAEQEFGSYLAVSDLIERLPLKLNISSITG